MSILQKLFKQKGPIESVLESTQKTIFQICGVNAPSEAQRLRASFYLCIAGTALLNRGGKPFYPSIDEVFDATRRMVVPLSSLRVNELATSKEDLAEILGYFPKDLEVQELTRINGMTAINALSDGRTSRLIDDILHHAGDIDGMAPYAGRVVAEGIFGKEKARAHVIPISLTISTYSVELAKAAVAFLKENKRSRA